jgi:uncharacterized protein (TIGR03083 family)
MVIEPLKPVLTAHLLRQVEDKLLELLGGLSAGEWDRPTIVPGWTVKNIAAHLLDTQLRKLSMVRDGYCQPQDGPRSGEDLPSFINRLNAEGVSIYSRLSPGLLTALMEQISMESARFHIALDPYAPAQFAVSWAGETESQNWFDTARELTERWHHQQQIRLAVSRPGIMTPELYFPVLDTFMRALPYHYRDVDAETGSLIVFTVTGECGGNWRLYRGPQGWQLIASPAGNAIAGAVIPQETAWRIFTKGISSEEAARIVSLTGDKGVSGHILTMLSIVA